MKKLKKGQLILYAFAGFGPSLLGTIISVYLINALSVSALNPEESANLTYSNVTIVQVALFSILVLIARLLDGITDIPFAGMTDSLKTKWGKRRPAILIGFLPMVASYIGFCFIPGAGAFNLTNTIYYGVLLMVFFSAYTLTFVTYYGTYSEVTESAEDRIKLSNWKAFFDTIQYSIGYALIPVFVSFDINIRMIGLYASPLFLTMILPFFMLKEKSTRPEDVAKQEAEIDSGTEPKEEEVSFWQSIKLTVKNKGFMTWLAVMAVFFFGLQLFLAGQTVYASGAMGLLSWQIAIINTSAFAPVPLMLWLYRKVMKKKGFRFAFQTALFAFALAMITFAVAYVEWIPSQLVRMIIGAIGGTIGSYGIGAFFSAPYIIPSQMAAEEMERTGKSHPSMYFAMQGFFNAIVAAISTSIVWLNIRELNVNFQGGIENNFGAHLMPFIVAAACLIAILVAFALPKSFSKLGREEKIQLTE